MEGGKKKNKISLSFKKCYIYLLHSISYIIFQQFLMWLSSDFLELEIWNSLWNLPSTTLMSTVYII